MPIYVSQGRYSREAIKGMVYAPEDRSKVVQQLCENAGSKVHAFYVTFGEYDWLLIHEAPSETEAAAIVLAAAAGGGIIDTKTCLAMTGPDAMKAFEKAGVLARTYRTAGTLRPS